MIEIKKELMVDVIEELEALAPLHWEEVGVHKGEIPLSMDWERYAILEEMGYFHFVSVRIDGIMVGYCAELLNTHLHYKAHKFAVNDFFFIHPDHRNKQLGTKLFKYVEQCLKDLGVSVWVVHTKTHVTAAPLLKRLGFELTEENYSKYIGG